MTRVHYFCSVILNLTWIYLYIESTSNLSFFSKSQVLNSIMLLYRIKLSFLNYKREQIISGLRIMTMYVYTPFNNIPLYHGGQFCRCRRPE